MELERPVRAAVRQDVMEGWTREALEGKQNSGQILESYRKEMTDLRWRQGLVKKIEEPWTIPRFLS